MKQISFLPEPKYNPKYPPETSLAAKALRLMLQGMKICHPQFERLTDSWRLAAHILILKRLGWPVKKEDAPLEWSKSDDRKGTMVLYYLPQDLIELIGG